MSNEIYKAVSDLKKFNYEHIYDKANSEKDKIKIEKMFNKLFDYLYKVLENKKLDKNNNIYKIYLNHMPDEYKNNTSNARIVIDYVSGMTDEFFISEFSKIK